MLRLPPRFKRIVPPQPNTRRLHERDRLMTLCVAAVCDSGDSIACVYDAQLSLHHTSGEVLRKAARVNERWAMLFAGDEISKVAKIIERVKESLRGANDLGYDEMYRFVAETYRGALREKIEAVVLAHLGMSHAEFKDRGYERLGPQIFAECVFKAEQVRVGAEFLVCGFDDRQMPHVFGITEGGEDLNFQRSGLGAIGSGGIVAQHMLLFHKYSRAWTANVAVYHLCAAKFMAERAQLGRKTHASLLRARDEWLTEIDTKQIRTLWEQEGYPRPPKDLESKVQLKTITVPAGKRAKITTSAM